MNGQQQRSNKNGQQQQKEPPAPPPSYSVYSVLATYLSNAVKNEQTVRGYVDGENNFNAFMNEYNTVCGTKFTTRTSWRKSASNLPRRVRYGKEGTVRSIDHCLAILLDWIFEF